MGAITSAAIAIAAVILGWITIEIACKPCLDQGREAMDRSLNPDFDPDDVVEDHNIASNLQAPLIDPRDKTQSGDVSSSAPPLIKTV